MVKILLAMGIGNMVAVLMLFLELRNIQERITTVQNGAVQLINASVEAATKEYAQRVPLLEQRSERLTAEVEALTLALDALRSQAATRSGGVGLPARKVG